MLKYIFRKENAFNMILFGSIVLLAFFKKSETLNGMSLWLSLLILILSILSMIISPLDEMIAGYDKNVLYYYNDMSTECWVPGIYEHSRIIDAARKCKYNDAISYLKDSFYPNSFVKEAVLKALFFINKRKKIRIIRKIVLSLYYMTIFAIVVSIMLMNELKPFIEQLHIMDCTIWSLLVILFQVFFSDSIKKYFDYEFEGIDDIPIENITDIKGCRKKKRKGLFYNEKMNNLIEQNESTFAKLWDYFDSKCKEEKALALLAIENANLEMVVRNDLPFMFDDFYMVTSVTEKMIVFHYEEKFFNIVKYSYNCFEKISSDDIEDLKNIDLTEIFIDSEDEDNGKVKNADGE